MTGGRAPTARGIAPVSRRADHRRHRLGSGSRGVVINEQTHQKKIIFHPQMMPGVVISDPELTVGLPPKITAATGIDAFVHCFEAFCAPGFHPLADGIALEGMRLIQTYLPRACADGQDIEARSRMLAAASMGATAFQKGLGGVHAIAHPVGAYFNTHHGLTNAVLLPYVIVHNRPAIESRLAIVARTLEPARASRSRPCSTGCCEFRKRLEIPHSLAEIGVPLSNPEIIGHEASLDPSAGGQPAADRCGDLRADLPLGGQGRSASWRAEAHTRRSSSSACCHSASVAAATTRPSESMLSGFAVPVADPAAGALHDRNDGHEVVRFQLHLDHQIAVTPGEHAVEVAVPAVAAQRRRAR